jgi:hypothetical protein
VLINTTAGTPDPSVSQCQTGESRHGYLNTATVISGQDTYTAQACTAISQTTPPAPAPPPPAGPTPALGFTGFAATDFLTAAFGLLITGTLLVLLARRRTRNRAL